MEMGQGQRWLQYGIQLCTVGNLNVDMLMIGNFNVDVTMPRLDYYINFLNPYTYIMTTKLSTKY